MTIKASISDKNESDIEIIIISNSAADSFAVNKDAIHSSPSLISKKISFAFILILTFISIVEYLLQQQTTDKLIIDSYTDGYQQSRRLLGEKQSNVVIYNAWSVNRDGSITMMIRFIKTLCRMPVLNSEEKKLNLNEVYELDIVDYCQTATDRYLTMETLTCKMERAAFNIPCREFIPEDNEKVKKIVDFFIERIRSWGFKDIKNGIKKWWNKKTNVPPDVSDQQIHDPNLESDAKHQLQNQNINNAAHDQILQHNNGKVDAGAQEQNTNGNLADDAQDQILQHNNGKVDAGAKEQNANGKFAHAAHAILKHNNGKVDAGAKEKNTNGNFAHAAHEIEDVDEVLVDGQKK